MIETPISELAWSSFSLLPLLKVHPIFLQDIPTKIFAESLWDKIFDTEIVAALGNALGDKNMIIRASTINFFTAALAQGVHVLCCF